MRIFELKHMLKQKEEDAQLNLNWQKKLLASMQEFLAVMQMQGRGDDDLLNEIDLYACIHLEIPNDNLIIESLKKTYPALPAFWNALKFCIAIKEALYKNELSTRLKDIIVTHLRYEDITVEDVLRGSIKCS